jgi:hypothetical protein
VISEGNECIYATIKYLPTKILASCGILWSFGPGVTSETRSVATPEASVVFVVAICGERGGEASDEMKESKRVPQVRGWDRIF